MDDSARSSDSALSWGFWDKLVPLSPWLDPEVAKRDEWHNAIARLAWTVIIAGWVPVVSGPRGVYAAAYIGCAVFVLFSVGYLWTVRRWPEPSRARRAAALLYDNLGVNYIAFFGGPLAPIAWFLLWTTVAFGIRFGPAYVPRAVVVAVAGLVVNLLFSPYWGTHLVIGFSVLFVLVGIGAGSWVGFRDIASAHERTANRARLDALTGLPNRPHFTERLSQALTRARRTGLTAALLLLDLDGFKLVNDSLGHAAGDGLLKKVGEGIIGRIRASDFAARLGGDEFVVLLEGVRSRNDAARVADELISLVAGLPSGAATVTVGASVGIVLIDPAQPRRVLPEELLQRVDDAMYEAKRAGKGRYAFSD